MTQLERNEADIVHGVYAVLSRELWPQLLVRDSRNLTDEKGNLNFCADMREKFTNTTTTMAAEVSQRMPVWATDAEIDAEFQDVDFRAAIGNYGQNDYEEGKSSAI